MPHLPDLAAKVSLYNNGPTSVGIAQSYQLIQQENIAMLWFHGFDYGAIKSKYDGNYLPPLVDKLMRMELELWHRNQRKQVVNLARQTMISVAQLKCLAKKAKVLLTNSDIATLACTTTDTLEEIRFFACGESHVLAWCRAEASCDLY
ncbi:MAG: hypothetical protein CL678_17435 [Bdellovibrionaceae bacterium]|nr:hypothetical protein [Pseudobdellovibrionaceae bacterium]|tara:strand:- start:3251 stop:3694 length:444 start_codon:yes stop_codon:yes gene_type:complete